MLVSLLLSLILHFIPVPAFHGNTIPSNHAANHGLTYRVTHGPNHGCHKPGVFLALVCTK